MSSDISQNAPTHNCKDQLKGDKKILRIFIEESCRAIVRKGFTLKRYPLQKATKHRNDHLTDLKEPMSALFSLFISFLR